MCRVGFITRRWGLREFDEDLMMEEEDGLARIRNIKELSNFCKIILNGVQH